MFVAMMMSGRPRINRSVTISADVENYNLINDEFGGVAPSGDLKVNIEIESGVVVYSSTPLTPAMDLTGLPDGSTINLLNFGLAVGGGGGGGIGGSVDMVLDEGVCVGGTSGDTSGIDGGDSITCDGDVTLNITNAAGEIFGGGGGGGGASACVRSIEPCQSGAAGGGGGGAGGIVVGGDAGFGGISDYFGVEVCTADDGNDGTGGSSGAGGSGGAGCGGACTGGDGGPGGEYGASGTVGGDGGKAGGSGGGSVNHSGIGSVVYISGGVQGVDIKGTTS